MQRLKNQYILAVISFLFPASQPLYQVALVIKNPLASAGDTKDLGSFLVSERSPGVGNGNPLQYSCLENSMGRGARQATVHGAIKSCTQLKRVACMQVSNWAYTQPASFFPKKWKDWKSMCLLVVSGRGKEKQMQEGPRNSFSLWKSAHLLDM